MPQKTGGLISDTAIVFLCRVGGAALVFITQIVLARSIGAEHLGIYVYASSACILLSTVACLGLPTAVMRFIPEGLARERADLVTGFVRRSIQVVLVVSVLVASLGTASLLSFDRLIPSEYKNALLLAILSIPLFALILIHGANAHGFSWFRTTFLPNDIFRPLLLLIAILIAKFNGYELSADIVMLLHMAVMVVILVFLSPAVLWRVNYKFPKITPKYQTRLWIRTAVPLLGITLFVVYFTELTMITVGIYLDAEQLAIFNASFRVAILIAFGIHAIDATTMPKASELYAAGDKKALQAVIRRTTVLKCFGSVAAVIGLSLFGEYILALFGKPFLAGYQPLMILAIGQLLRAIFGPVTQLMSISGHQDHCLYVFLFALIAMITLQPILIDQFGINGAALTVVIVIFVQSIWLHLLVMRYLSINPSLFAIGNAFIRR